MKITFPAALFLMFLALKLTGQIDWSWWWVTCPLWAGLAVLGFFLGASVALSLLAAGVLWVLTKWDARKVSPSRRSDRVTR